MEDAPRVGSKEAEQALGHLYGMTRKLSGEINMPNGPVKVDADVFDGCAQAYQQVKQFLEQHSKCGLRELKSVKEEEAQDAATDPAPEDGGSSPHEDDRAQ
jgi:hypothetical protein